MAGHEREVTPGKKITHEMHHLAPEGEKIGGARSLGRDGTLHLFSCIPSPPPSPLAYLPAACARWMDALSEWATRGKKNAHDVVYESNQVKLA